MLAVVLGLLGVSSAVALPFAPVLVDRPVLSWPLDPAAPRPTMAMLTAYRPLAIDASFSCRQASAATVAAPAVVLATTRPDAPSGVAAGLVVSVADGLLTTTARGVVVARDPVGPAPCRYTLSGRGEEIVLSRDGRELGRGPMPDVDALTTAVGALPGATISDLSVRLTVDDRFATTPAPLKVALLAVLALGGLGSLGLLVVFDRHDRVPRPRPPPRRRSPWSRLGATTDVAVAAVLLIWMFLGPLTPDDGYYSAMATNAGVAGYVGNYYQLYNQGFTPFTWTYQALSWWQGLVGVSPVAVRVPSVVCGLLTWLCVRRLVLAVARDRRTGLAPLWTARGALTTTAAGVAFLAWWMPFDLGVRPEPVIALATVAALLAVVLAAERSSLLLVGVAVAAASLGATAAPTGLVALAPLVAGLPRLWPLLRGTGSRPEVTGRVACVLAPGGLGAAAAFADGSWRDFVRTQQLLGAVQTTETWSTEYKRWVSLFDPGSASFAARAAVLVTVLGLLVLGVLWAATLARARPLPARLVAVGVTTALALLLLWPTPSKPWMHFGALAGIGAALIGLLAVEAPRAVAALRDGRGPARGPLVLAGAAVALVLAVAGSGVNRWWLTGWMLLPHAGTPPQVWVFRFDQPLWWAAGALALTWVLRTLLRRRGARWRSWAPVLALSTTVVVFLGANVAYMLGVFGLEAARAGDSWSLAAQNLRDPAGAECGAGSWIEAAAARGPVLAVDPRAPPPAPVGPGFAPGTGWYEASPPPVPADRGTAWGSLVVAPERLDAPPEASTGSLTTAWWQLPEPGTDRTVTSLVSGRVGAGNSLTVEYAKFVPAGVAVVASRVLGVADDPSVSSTAWRSVDLGGGPVDAELVRLVAVDGRTDVGGWLAVTAPRLSPFAPVNRLVGDGGPTALSWQAALLFPCLRQPRIQNGITEPAAWAVGNGDEPLEMLQDGTWQVGRGGVFGQTLRQASTLQLSARFRGLPESAGRLVQAYRLEQPYPAAAYRLDTDRRLVSGAAVSESAPE